MRAKLAGLGTEEKARVEKSLSALLDLLGGMDEEAKVGLQDRLEKAGEVQERQEVNDVSEIEMDIERGEQDFPDTIEDEGGSEAEEEVEFDIDLSKINELEDLYNLISQLSPEQLMELRSALEERKGELEKEKKVKEEQLGRDAEEVKEMEELISQIDDVLEGLGEVIVAVTKKLTSSEIDEIEEEINQEEQKEEEIDQEEVVEEDLSQNLDEELDLDEIDEVEADIEAEEELEVSSSGNLGAEGKEQGEESGVMDSGPAIRGMGETAETMKIQEEFDDPVLTADKVVALTADSLALEAQALGGALLDGGVEMDQDSLGTSSPGTFVEGLEKEDKLAELGDKEDRGFER